MPQPSTINEGLDAQLLAANELRRQKMALDQVDSSGQTGRIGESGTFKDWAAALRETNNVRRQAMNLKEAAKDKLKEKALAPAKQGTSHLLKLAWLNVIDSFGLTLIWINIHVFLRFVVGEQLFCKLGREWLPPEVSQVSGQGADTAGKGWGLLEAIVLLIVDFIILGVIFGALAIIVMIVNFMGENWWGKLKDIWTAFNTLGWGAVKTAISSLF